MFVHYYKGLGFTIQSEYTHLDLSAKNQHKCSDLDTNNEYCDYLAMDTATVNHSDDAPGDVYEAYEILM